MSRRRPLRGLALSLAVLAPLGACLADPLDDAEDDAGLPDVARALAPGGGETLRYAYTAPQLVQMLQSPGTIIIPDGVGIDLSNYRQIPIAGGVHLYGQRTGTKVGGHVFNLNTGLSPWVVPPCLPGTSCDANYPLFVINGNGVRIEGLRIEGPYKGGVRYDGMSKATGIWVDATQFQDVQIDHCELWGWNMQAISIGGANGPGHIQADKWRVLDNSIHDNAEDGKGYGVDVGGTWATIEGNVFDRNRHAIASNGSPGSGYIARYNYILEGARCNDASIGCYYNQHFDVHGQGEGGYGGDAGEYFMVGSNTFRGDQGYYVTKTRPAFQVRGAPVEGAYLAHNVLMHDDDGEALRSDYPRVYPYGNLYHTDVSSEVQVGDLDADGRDDVFLATSNTWFYSSAGLTEWRRINIDWHRTSELALGQFDADPRIDVLTVDAGRFYVSSGGVGPWTPLGVVTDAPVVGSLRFGNFDADPRTDVIKTDGNTVWVSYAGTGPWLPLTAAQGIPFTDLLFGDLDGNGRTDMFRIGPSSWLWKSGGIGGWRLLNDRKTTSLSGLVLADFDGDGHADVGRVRGGAWGYWSGGTAATFTAMPTPSASDIIGDAALVVGKFTGDARKAEPLAWGRWYQNSDRDTWGSPFAVSVDGVEAWRRWSRRPMR